MEDWFSWPDTRSWIPLPTHRHLVIFEVPSGIFSTPTPKGIGCIKDFCHVFQLLEDVLDTNAFQMHQGLFMCTTKLIPMSLSWITLQTPLALPWIHLIDSCCEEGFRSLTGLVSYVPAAADVTEVPSASRTVLDKHGHKIENPDLQLQQYESRQMHSEVHLHFWTLK